MTASDTPRPPRDPAENIDLARYQRFAAAARAARAASLAASALVADERDVLARIKGTWEMYATRLPPKQRDLAEELIGEDQGLRAKAIESGVGRRFPVGLAEQLLDHRAKLAALQAEANPAAERAQHLGELADSLSEYLRDRGLLEADRSSPALRDRGGREFDLGAQASAAAPVASSAGIGPTATPRRTGGKERSWRDNPTT